MNNLSTSVWHRHLKRLCVLEKRSNKLWDIIGLSRVVTIRALKNVQRFSDASVTTFPSSVSTVINSTKVMLICYVALTSKHIPNTSAQPAFLAVSSCCDMYTVPLKLGISKYSRKQTQGSARRDFCFLPAHYADCSDHHLFHFGRGDRERDAERGSFGRELSPQAFLLASMRNSGRCTSSSLSLAQWKARKRFQLLRKSRGKCLEHHIEYRQVDPKWSKGLLVIDRSKYIQILFIPIDWYLMIPNSILFNPIHTGLTLSDSIVIVWDFAIVVFSFWSSNPALRKTDQNFFNDSWQTQEWIIRLDPGISTYFYVQCEKPETAPSGPVQPW